jgi:hypothetical protein
MIIESERDMETDENEFREANDPPILRDRTIAELNDYMAAYHKIQDRPTSKRLQQDLIEHHWMLKGNEIGPYARRSRQ